MEEVWVNIKNMDLRRDLTDIPQIIDNNHFPRYYLSNEEKECKDLYLIKANLFLVNKTSGLLKFNSI